MHQRRLRLTSNWWFIGCSNGTGAYLPFWGNLTTQTFQVPINADRGHAKEYFYVDLSSPANAAIGKGRAVVTILQ